MIKVDIGIPELDRLAYAITAHAVGLFDIPEDVTINVHGGDMSHPDNEAECRTDDAGNFLVLFNAEQGWTVRHFIEVLGHELTHVKQHVHDGLDLDEKTVYFRGQYFRTHWPVEYWLAPWEVEARGHEAYFWWYANEKGLISEDE